MTRALIIAEAGVNHNGSVERARRLVEAAARAGADCVKFQTFKASRLVTAGAEMAGYQKQNVRGPKSQFALLKDLEIADRDHFALKQQADALGIEFLSTPFDTDSARFLVGELGLKRLKIPSGEVTNGPLLLEIARLQVPVILSTGMCDLAEIETALGVLAYGYLGVQERPSPAAFQKAYASKQGWGALEQNVIILHCTSQYPAAMADVHLRAMQAIQAEFALPVGYSDHTLGLEVPIAAVAMGAVCVEKHFTLDKNLPGPDHKASLDAEELAAMVKAIRNVERALGEMLKNPQASELETRKVARRSVVAARDIKTGETFDATNLTLKRPGSGISPMRYWSLLGKTARHSYAKDELIRDEDA